MKTNVTDTSIRRGNGMPLLRFLLSLFAISVLTYSAHAQIVYSDIEPDLSGMTLNETVLGQNFQWGMLNGNQPRFSTSSNFPLVMVAPGQVNSLLRISAGDTVGPSATWNTDSWTNPGSTAVSVNKYLGFRVGIPGNYRYGWFKIDVNSTSSQWKIKSYAYEQTFNKFIIAGDIGSVNNDDDDEDITVMDITVDGQGGVSDVDMDGGTLQMVATVTPTNATHMNVEWSLENGTGTATIDETGIVTGQSAGTVIIKAKAMDASNVSSTKTIMVTGQPLGIANINLIAGRFYPNPARERLVLQFDKEESINNITIRNLIGGIVYNDDRAIRGNTVYIDIGFLPEGLYILTYQNTTGKQGVQKFVKTK